MHGSRSKIPSKVSRQAALRGGINSDIKGLIDVYIIDFYVDIYCFIGRALLKL
jgi:hypothetical protein